MRSNPFYPSAGQSVSISAKMQEERKLMHEKNEKIVSDWGFQNEETKKLFEARLLR
jgi:hypothetical protein